MTLLFGKLQQGSKTILSPRLGQQAGKQILLEEVNGVTYVWSQKFAKSKK